MRNLKLSEDHFDLKKINKYATLMTLGNGYMGIRGTHEEDYPIQKRGLFVAGIYNNSSTEEPEEIVNLPDVMGIDLEIDGEVFSSLKGKTISYDRTLHMDRGELTKDVVWEREDGLRLQFTFRRLASKHDVQVLASKVSIESLNRDVTITLRTGIDAQQTNFGRQHLLEDHVQVHDETYMQGTYTTTRSHQTIGLFSTCTYSKSCDVHFFAKNRQLLCESTAALKKNEPFHMEKLNAVYTSIDQRVDDLKEVGLAKVKQLSEEGYERILQQSENAWEDFWNERRIEIHSSNPMDQQAIDFAQYHLEIMAPKHNPNLSVAAKGLTGEGYKGHVFWDSEIFILPYHLYNDPKAAKQLLEYRYNRLPEARERAKANGHEGAQFPWESARTGKEETPAYAAINIKTGERQKVASALAEHHIVADIAYAVLHYYQVTNDEEFMAAKGLTMLEETSKFWLSRTSERDGQLHLLNVIGPDEYTEFIDNNAYTNYLAHYIVKQTLQVLDAINELNEEFRKAAEDFLNRLYLPKENADQLIPQDGTFLRKPAIDLSKYKKNQGSQSILLDYSRGEVNEMQILKQADVVMLLYLFPDLFSKETIERNFTYYEEKTIHDSSLSKAIHSILAMRCGQEELAYQLFQEACLIDLGPNPHSSDEGIHAASLGSIWLAVFSFLNLSFEQERIKLNPTLPQAWSSFKFPFHYKGRKITVEMNQDALWLEKVGGDPIDLEIGKQRYQLIDHLEIPLHKDNELHKERT
ncbi:glycoside hydrolase family 65 protein [Halobacillus naozhouensis]|uniref:Glycoside hydrolase family 65 protein n=1 Tax=Halobacillus naozhouensis TaxID=554880 RepID=A0ABY8J0I6_9BACI|nr:glycoside hydrolase family 65 protein [Halobacillus naozhouensis]WFT75586.1 glycoside hydrolase family 65 protein [Halobacillus naozhouensis]